MAGQEARAPAPVIPRQAGTPQLHSVTKQHMRAHAAVLFTRLQFWQPKSAYSPFLACFFPCTSAAGEFFDTSPQPAKRHRLGLGSMLCSTSACSHAAWAVR